MEARISRLELEATRPQDERQDLAFQGLTAFFFL